MEERRASERRSTYERQSAGAERGRYGEGPVRTETPGRHRSGAESGRAGTADGRKNKNLRRKETKESSRASAPELPGMAKNMEDISAVIRGMKFRRRLLGGVDELDVWRQLEKLQREYRSAYEAQQERSKALLKERDIQISQLKKQLVLGNYGRGVTNGQK